MDNGKKCPLYDSVFGQRFSLNDFLINTPNALFISLALLENSEIKSSFI